MMKLKSTLFAFTTLLTSSAFAEPTPTLAPNNLPARMQALNAQLSLLLTDVSSDERFHKPENKSRIEKEIKDFAQMAHELKTKELSSPKVDPTLSVLSGYFVQETKNAYDAFKEGKTLRAQNILKSIPSSCISCHSRNNYGPEFDKHAFEPSEILKQPMELGQFYSATRQFDRALAEYSKVLSNPEMVEMSPWIWEEALHQSLAISIRVKKDPVLTLKTIDGALAQKNSSYYIKQNLNQWKKNVEAWKKEGKSKTTTEEQIFTQGKSILTAARKQQKYPMDHSADILFLRASSLFYDLLQVNPNSKHVSEALLLLGVSSEVMMPRGLESLHQSYYEACIQKSPHSKIALECYQHFEQSTIYGFTGSAGTHIPDEVKGRLLELWSLALPTAPLNPQLR